MKILFTILLFAFIISNASADLKKSNITRKPSSTISDVQAVVIDINRKFQIYSEQLPQKGLKDSACESMQQILGELDGARIIADLAQAEPDHQNPAIFSRKILGIQTSIVSLTGFCGDSVSNGIKKNDIIAVKALSNQIEQNLGELQNSFLQVN